MGYLDAVTSGNFKQDADGRHLFFPWGILGRGYVIPSDQEYERFRKVLVKVCGYAAVGLAAAIGVLGALAPPAPLWVLLVLVLLCVLGYGFWIRRVTHGWPRSSERLSFHESFRNQALRQSPLFLCVGLIGSSVFVLIGVLILVSGSDQLLGAAFFAVVGIVGAVSCWSMLSSQRAHIRRCRRLYNVACRHAVQGDRDQAFDSLAKAVKAGYDDTDHMGWDPDLNSLRDEPRYAEILSSMESSSNQR